MTRKWRYEDINFPLNSDSHKSIQLFAVEKQKLENQMALMIPADQKELPSVR